MKRPATKKTKEWKSVSYVRGKVDVPSRGLRMEQVEWKRSVKELLCADNATIVKILQEDGLLPEWGDRVCPRCEKGVLSGFCLKPGDSFPKYRCKAKGCNVYINPHHLHPLFTDESGVAATPLQTQAAMLLLKLNNVTKP